MALWDKVREGIDKAGKVAQGAVEEGKLRIDAYRAREQADKAAEALGYAIFRAGESGTELDADARNRLMSALRERDAEAKRLEADLAASRAASGNEETSTQPPPPGTAGGAAPTQPPQGSAGSDAPAQPPPA